MNISDFMQLTVKHPEIPDHNKEDWNKEDLKCKDWYQSPLVVAQT